MNDAPVPRPRWRTWPRLAWIIAVMIAQLFLIAAMSDRRLADFVYQGF